MSDILDETQVASTLKKMPEWDLEGKSIARTIEFEDFNDAIDFVNGLAEIAEEAQHHPDMLIRYNKVKVMLSTHDVGGITELDFELASRIDNMVD